VLQEVSATQVEHEPSRRWFTDEDFDLVVWFSDPDSIVGFQLSYDRRGAEQAVTWTTDRGWEHFRVDAGEETPKKNLTPILVSGGSFPREQVVVGFAESSGAIDPAVRAFVLQRLREAPL
jgi:hypothetical protein